MATNMQRFCASTLRGFHAFNGIAVPIDPTFIMKDRFAFDPVMVHGISAPISWESPPLLISW